MVIGSRATHSAHYLSDTRHKFYGIFGKGLIMNVKDTYRHFLRNGMNSMLKVSCHLFTAIGNGGEWIDGELCFGEMSDWYELRKNPVKDEERGLDYLRSLHNRWDLEHEAYLTKRQFVMENIERILDSPIDSNLFEGSDVVRNHYEANPSVEYAASIIFPDDIKPDWAEAVYKFNQWWLTNLNVIYGVGHNGNTDFWPDRIKVAYRAIDEAGKRAFKIFRGVDYETHFAEIYEGLG